MIQAQPLPFVVNSDEMEVLSKPPPPHTITTHTEGIIPHMRKGCIV